MKKSKKLYRNILIILAAIYVAITLINQQKTLNTYKSNQEQLASQIDDASEYKEELSTTKDNVDSSEFIEQMAREKLDMYLPNERVYVDKGM